MTYSYDRTASPRAKTASMGSELIDLTPKLYQALKKAVGSETNRKAKDALQDALKQFEEVLDLLRVAQHESEESLREASFDLDAGIKRLNIQGRDQFYTHLIKQETGMWLARVLDGEEAIILAEEVPWLEGRRGFNDAEKAHLRRLAHFFVSNAEAIRRGMKEYQERVKKQCDEDPPIGQAEYGREVRLDGECRAIFGSGC